MDGEPQETIYESNNSLLEMGLIFLPKVQSVGEFGAKF